MGEMTPGRRFYEEHLAYINDKDFDGLIDNHYNDDAVFTSFYGCLRGREALRQHFQTYLGSLGNLRVRLDKLTETDDTLLLETTVTTDAGTIRTYDAFVLRNGKVSYQFYGVFDQPAGG
jgi:ketosteroid isomerase-like protein